MTPGQRERLRGHCKHERNPGQPRCPANHLKVNRRAVKTRPPNGGRKRRRLRSVKKWPAIWTLSAPEEPAEGWSGLSSGGWEPTVEIVSRFAAAGFA